MAEDKFLVDLNLNSNEIQNAVLQNLATAPNSPKKGQAYFNTTDNKAYMWNGTAWVDITNQGKIYSEGTGIDISNADVISLDANLGDLKNVTITNPSTGQNLTYDATNNVWKNTSVSATIAWGGITGTLSDQTDLKNALDGKVTGNTAITGATKTKITYDSKGLVTSGADLEASDIPNLSLSKITDVTATASEVNVLDGITASTAELNILDGVTATATEINVLDGITASTTELNYVDGVTSSIQTQLDNKLAKKPDETNDLIDSGNKITTTYLPDFILGQMLYAGTFVPSTAVATLTTNAKAKLGTTSNTITLTNDGTAITGYVANEGCYYICSADGTFASLSLLTGDWLVSTGSAWKKIDNTDAVTGVKGSAETNYRTGNVNITADNVMPTQSGNSGKFLTTDGTNVSWGSVDAFPTQTGNSGKFLTTDGSAVSWASVLQKISVNNPALTASGGECTWTIAKSNLPNTTEEVEVHVYEASSGQEVRCQINISSSTGVTIKMNSASNISANTYKAIIIG